MSSTESNTLLGLVQRGRGAGFEAALTQPAQARAHVVDCIVRDPRWDHQVEQRDWLYAALVAELGIEPARLRAIECLDDCESETRALGVIHASDRMPMVRERIRGMAEDVTEEDYNRRTAAARITQWC